MKVSVLITVYEGSDPVGLVNATKLVSDRRRNGVAFIRYKLPLVFVDQKYDVPANMAEKMMVIRTEGLFRGHIFPLGLTSFLRILATHEEQPKEVTICWRRWIIWASGC